MENRERKWIKYRENQHWKAFKREWNRFVTMPRYKKHDLIYNLVNMNTTYSKKLYKIVTEITGQNKQNPLPESTSDQQLAKDFVAFFLNKIQNIRKLFKGTHTYTPNPMTHHIWIDSQHWLMQKSTKPYLECDQNHANLSTISSKNSQPLNRHMRVLQKMKIHSSAANYQGIWQRDSQHKLQTSEKSTIYLQNNRKVYPKSTNDSLWHTQPPPRIPISLQTSLQLWNKAPKIS